MYQINLWLYTVDQDLNLEHILFGAVKLTTNRDTEKFTDSGYGIGFNVRRSFLLLDDSGFGKNVIKFGADISPSLHVDHRKEGILIFGKGLTQRVRSYCLQNLYTLSIFVNNKIQDYVDVCMAF